MALKEKGEVEAAAQQQKRPATVKEQREEAAALHSGTTAAGTCVGVRLFSETTGRPTIYRETGEVPCPKVSKLKSGFTQGSLLSSRMQVRVFLLSAAFSGKAPALPNIER